MTGQTLSLRNDTVKAAVRDNIDISNSCVHMRTYYLVISYDLFVWFLCVCGCHPQVWKTDDTLTG